MSAAKLDLRFDAERLAEAVGAVPPSAWISHFNVEYYDGEWSAVALRSPVGADDTILPAPGSEERTYVDTVWCTGYLTEVLAAFRCPVQSARLMKLGPGARIREHHDPDVGLGWGLVRLHVAITTNPDVDLRVAGERVVLQAGECWYVDFGLPHAVTNAGTTDRVHLVLDCCVDDWLGDKLTAAGIDVPEGEPVLDGRPEDVPQVIAALRRLGTPAALEQARRLESSL